MSTKSDSRAVLSDTDFITLFEKAGPYEIHRNTGISLKSVFHRRVNLEKKYRRQITPPRPYNRTRRNIQHPGRIHYDVLDGHVLVASDAHYWTGPPSVAHRAFVKFCEDCEPKLVVFNGDAMDGAKISRHPPINWEDRPEVVDELEAVKLRLGEIEEAVPGNAKLCWTLGNHDSRFETRLATQAPEYARIHGFHLKDHFGKRWEPAWSAWINENVVVKHRITGGMHATRNNVIRSGMTTITGHLHSLQVRPLSTYADRPLWGVDCGMLARPYGPQFAYTEDNPVDWRSGFILLTFYKGILLWPEIIHYWDDDHVEFRGKLIKC